MSKPIAVVGAGIAGASVAFHLGARTDADVVVFERGTVGSATTARSTAVFRIMDDPVLAAMKRDGMALYNRLAADASADPGFELLGRLEVATTEAGAARLRERSAEVPNGSYVDGEALPRAVFCPELDPTAVCGALHQPNAGAFRPAALARELADRAEAAGVAFRTDEAVTDVETDDDRVTAVRTPNGRTPVSHVVAAAGPWNRDLGRLVGLELPIRHTLAPILVLEPGTEAVHTHPNIKHAESGYYTVGRADGAIMVGHSPGGYDDAGTEYDPDEVDETVPESIADGAFEALGDLVPSVVGADLVDQWVGVRSLTPDGRPLVGPTPVDGFSLVAFNSEGIQLAPAAGRAVAGHLGDAAMPEYADAVDPGRLSVPGADG